MRDLSKFLVASLVFMAGCGDPETDRLSTGDKVIAFEYKSHDGSKYDGVLLRDCNSCGDELYPKLDFGAHLTVVQDEGEERRAGREVLVHVEDGQWKGHTGKVSRWSLRKSPN